MNTALKIGGYTLGLLAVFGAAVGVGAAVTPAATSAATSSRLSPLKSPISTEVNSGPITAVSRIQGGGGKPPAPDGKEGGIGHEAVYLPPY